MYLNVIKIRIKTNIRGFEWVLPNREKWTSDGACRIENHWQNGRIQGKQNLDGTNTIDYNAQKVQNKEQRK